MGSADDNQDDQVRGYWINSKISMTLVRGDNCLRLKLLLTRIQEDIKAIMEDTLYWKDERDDGSTGRT